MMSTRKPRAGVPARRLMLAAALAGAFTPTTAVAQAGLTLADAVRAAREQNPDMQAQRNDIHAARAAVRSARMDFLPSASVNGSLGYTAAGVQRFGSEVFGRRPDYYSSSYTLGLSYDLSGAKLFEPSIARSEERATERRIAGYEADLVARVTQQYLVALQAREQAEQAAREVERTRAHEKLAQARLELGAGTPLDLSRARVQRGRAEATHLQATNNHATELLRLGEAMGRAVEPGTPLVTAFELFEPRWEAARLVEWAREANPTLRAARASADAARGRVRAARSEYLPTLQFDVGVRSSVYSAGSVDPLVDTRLRQLGDAFEGCQAQRPLWERSELEAPDCSGLNPSDPEVIAAVRRDEEAGNPSFPFGFERQPLSASLTVSLPVFNGLRRERRVEEARVAAGDADLAVRARENKLAADVGAGLLAVKTAYGTARLQEEVVANAAHELRVAQERFRLGVAAAVEVTDAQTSLAEAERARIDAVYAYHRSLAALEALVGRDLRGAAPAAAPAQP
ncbi:MAG TPA: TolC family protein [Longimicrobium sp.]|nr:TolC family protein [Longimicrobium sp.]